MLNQLSPGYVEAIKREHRAIGEQAHQLQATLRDAVARGWPAGVVEDLAIRMKTLERTLVQHFAQEEEGGFLDEAVCSAPQYAAETSRLMHEHTEILARLREMIVRATGKLAAEPSQSYPFAKSLEATLRQLLMHETHENGLLKKAFNLDSDAI
jgi:hypothetical protein